MQIMPDTDADQDSLLKEKNMIFFLSSTISKHSIVVNL